ncbi:unnamed protein product [Triticum turgidum subsp. durum]|uniref:Uncharacterized protein n=1 Tax=Triticum turgidum subsp. durum TaxID=4567 RepID=A0A9R1QHL0_TRITD|nr:unnamed protein product [Triticum turgidum subsp. durum]
MRQGFARALVPYYPVAGRIAEPSPGDLVVDCTGEGVCFVTQVVEISPESILRIKDEFKAATGETCSTFDAVTAVVFKCRALAVDLPDAAEVRLGFAASTRHLLQGVLPSVDGYYGNCVYPVGITRSSKTIREAALPEVVGVMREAKEALKVRFTDWMHGGAKDDHYNVPLDYGTVTVSDWSRVGFNEVDYGFGEPGYVFTLNDDVNIVASVIYLKPPAPKRGIRLMLRCVEEPHAAVFADELAKYA